MRLAGVDAELSRAEFDKYAAPLLLLHGLWAHTWVWRPLSSYLAHRGWNSYTLAWSGAARNWDELMARARAAAAELGLPIVIGHDLGAVAAMRLEHVRAAVALNPLPCGPGMPSHPLSRSLLARFARGLGRDRVPSRTKAQRLFGVPADQLTPESWAWFDELASIAPPAPLPRPLLVLGGGNDALAAVEVTATIAASAGGTMKSYPAASHDLPYGRGWQDAAADLHRWLVQQLGESVLLLRGDEDLCDD